MNSKVCGGIYVEEGLQQFKADFFKALAHPLRIRILELLVDGKKNVNEIQSCLEKEGSAVSQQLSVLRGKNIVYGTKEGKKVYYSLSDPMIGELLGVAKDIFNNHLINTITRLEEMTSNEDQEEDM
ncbi:MULTISPECIES: helix-turn-helix transcriptional regulator [unclassified Lysinibacillus]|uniref:ArsR/SmtB family transcription factor n=1 Tax=Lysinibacillus sp. BPa_S21 TaxID=2932478 RepID=UPI0024B335E1|nr:metalloregulator ArsR/SmtB family transcription factor [Lysinibacillus sp. Bpr_S20]